MLHLSKRVLLCRAHFSLGLTSHLGQLLQDIILLNFDLSRASSSPKSEPPKIWVSRRIRLSRRALLLRLNLFERFHPQSERLHELLSTEETYRWGVISRVNFFVDSSTLYGELCRGVSVCIGLTSLKYEPAKWQFLLYEICCSNVSWALLIPAVDFSVKWTSLGCELLLGVSVSVKWTSSGGGLPHGLDYSLKWTSPGWSSPLEGLFQGVDVDLRLLCTLGGLPRGLEFPT